MKINFSINYKGYTADVSYEPEDKIYVGEVRGEAVLKSGKAGTSAFELLCDRIEDF